MRALSRLPVALMLGVAALQLGLWAFADLDPWLGGGFGMFSSAERRHLLAVRLDGGGVLEVPPELETLAERARALPLQKRLDELGRRWAEAQAVPGVRIEVWSSRPKGSPLRPRAQLLRASEVSLR